MTVLHPRRIFKYRINLMPGYYFERLPRGSEWLSIAHVGGHPVIYALVAAAEEYGEQEPLVDLQYQVVFTGDAVMYEASDLVGTLADPMTGLVIHVFRR